MLRVEDSRDTAYISSEDQKDSEQDKESDDSEQESRLTSPKETLKPSAQPTFEYYEKEEIEDVVSDEDSSENVIELPSRKEDSVYDDSEVKEKKEEEDTEEEDD
uniref:Ovule protein n=1 Tax=Strongyloides venezuelensis TaxID=75913 RepID=A0A0K0G657_STRVS